MPLDVLLVVLLGALLHASWNVLVKAGRDTQLVTAVGYSAAGLLAALVLPALPVPERATWPYLAASTAIEVLYGVLMAAAYRIGDLSHAYPLMRGTAPVLVAIGSATLIGESLSRGVWIGVALVASGIFALILDAGASGRSATATRLALLNAVVIAVYTTIDGLGVRVSHHPVAYSFWLSVLIAVPCLFWAAVRVRAAPREQLRRQIPLAALGGLCSLGSYTLALWAMTRAPIAAVAAARETSIVFGTVLGAWVLRERVTRARALAALAIALGVWAIRAH
jgi:drug/metabolite transporter (DMT)-like permease